MSRIPAAALLAGFSCKHGLGRKFRALALMLGLLAAPLVAAFAVETGPALPPCDPAASALVPAPTQPPQITLWRGGALPAGWTPPACAHWPVSQIPNAVMTISASFPVKEGVKGGESAVLARYAALSAARGIRYWSHHDQAWESLVVASTALSGPALTLPRGDFTEAELLSGQPAYFSQRDGRSERDILYAMTIRSWPPDGLVVTIRNVSDIKYFWFRILAPGDLVSITWLRPVSPGLWSYFGLVGVAEPLLMRFANPAESYINRAAANYRYIAGIPSDQEPPAAP